MTSSVTRRGLGVLAGLALAPTVGEAAPADKRGSVTPGGQRTRSRKIAKPSRAQLEFQDMEVGTFIHYSIDAFGGRSGKAPPSAFAPTDLDVRQWVAAAKAMGAQYVVLTARHEQGFCLWPTATTAYSIRNSPYKDGKGDVVREFVDACRDLGVRPGLYTAPWIDDNWDETVGGLHPEAGNADIGKYDDQALFDKVLAKERAQLTELLTNYGPLVFVWCDHFGRSDTLGDTYHGGRVRELYANLGRLAQALQPRCLYFGPDVEHVGNERARASYPLWNAVSPIGGAYSIGDTFKWERPNVGRPWGEVYRPRLAPTTDDLSSGGWMWSGPRTPAPWARQLDAYYNTVGRGAGVIINLAPDRTGRVPGDLVAAAKGFGDEIRRMFAHPVGQASGQGSAFVAQFDDDMTIDHIVLMEELEQGQTIARYRVEGLIGDDWKELCQGRTIGHKRIEPIAPVRARAVRLLILETLAGAASVRRFAAYNCRAS